MLGPPGRMPADEARSRFSPANGQVGAYCIALLYERYVDPIYAYALHCLRDRAAAEDVVAETFERALEHVARAEWRSVPISPWLYHLASRAITTHAWRVPLVPLDPAGHVSDSAVGPEQVVLRGERQQEVQPALATLPLLQCQALSLHYGQELPVEAIALILGRSTEARLLVWEVKDGWEPLCRFLGVAVPDVPFLRLNDREAFQLLAQQAQQYGVP